MADQQTDYQKTLAYLYEHLPQFSKQGKDAIKKDLTNIRTLCETTGNLHQQFKSIHIAGTNGKGSTSHALAAVLQESGYKVGLYTSPHLVDFRERIRINGEMVSPEFVVDFTSKKRELFDQVKPSFFEVTVLMAFAAFAEAKVDVAVIETGLGGRLDSTNIITPVLSIITNIGYDHTDILGNTLAEIAREKAGIIKPDVPVLIGEQHPETEHVFFETAVHQKSTVYYAESMWDLVKTSLKKGLQTYKAVRTSERKIYDLATDLQGKYQLTNLRTVLAAADLLPAISDYQIEIPVAIKALSKVAQLTGLRGRWEVLQQQPLIIADVAHNPMGIRNVMGQFNHLLKGEKHVVVGFAKDKDIEEALSFMPRMHQYYFCHADSPRAMPSKELQALAQTKGLDGYAYDSVAQAVTAAKNAMQHEDAMLITGSFYVVGEAMQAL